MGSYQEPEGRLILFLTKGDRLYTVSPGDVIDGIYRVTPVDGANIRFQLMLQMAGATAIYGPVLGQARDPVTGVVISISPEAPNPSSQRVTSCCMIWIYLTIFSWRKGA